MTFDLVEIKKRKKDLRKPLKRDVKDDLKMI